MQFRAFVNGKYSALEDAKVPVEDRGYQFADGVYEVVKFHGRHGLRLEAHLKRLAASAASLKIEGLPSAEEWHGIIARLMEECALPDDDGHEAILYQQVTRGAAPRNHLFPDSSATTPSVVAYFRKAPVYGAELRAAGIGLSVQPDERWNRCFIKSVALLPAVLAKQAARDAGAFEALLVRGETVTEGSATNAFCVRGGTIFTHPPGGAILSGITRDLVFEAAAAAGVGIREEAVNLRDFAAADEIFISSTTMNVMPATKLDGKQVGSGAVGEVTRRIASALDAIIAAERQAAGAAR